ncbi:hypothetical protein H9L05_14625 [Hymenobacter qilianensis]|uniref:Uncharacterized protein n=1 Tax=Hymenobacter qilianensis TaxID=1385715 RepID=A0A7H0GSM8_9BACT|nr:hypothetical protein [Hymenobacter qilianensis]QNP51294.1 hypothetical protein H9L05_14625 [Hymenobacter qilianensis]
MNNSLFSRLGLALVLLLLALPNLRAQNTRSADIEARIENARIAYITREVALTPSKVSASGLCITNTAPSAVSYAAPTISCAAALRPP